MKRDPRLWLRVSLLLTVCAIGGPAAQGSSAEESYVRLRDQAVARFAALRNIDHSTEIDEGRARGNLERRMRAILGPVRPQGFDAGKLNVTTLFRSQPGFGRLDGVLFETDRGDREMIVTTRTLLTRWLRTQQDWQDNTLRDLEAAIRSDAFHTRVARVDAAAVRFAELPVKAALGQPAFAMLAGRTQDRAPDEAGGVFVAALKGERAFIANAALKPIFGISVCTAMRVHADEKAAEITADRASAEQGDALLERFGAIRDRIESDFLRCFAERAPREPRFADAVKLANELYDRMAAR